jgi:ABC-type polysaccharide/polyol phosphate transport system ATPase subunit
LRGQPVVERRTIFEGLDLDVKPGERIAIVGKNGAGKSTLFRLMAGILAPDAGDIAIGGRISPLIEILAGLVIDMTGAENIRLNASILGLTNAQIRDRFDEMLAFADLGDFVDTPVRYYSSGMLARLGFSVAVHVDADIVLVDEVLAVGDATFQRRCLDRMSELSRRGTTIILVSHDLEAVRTFFARTAWIGDQRVLDDGPTERVLAAYTSAGSASGAPSSVAT